MTKAGPGDDRSLSRKAEEEEIPLVAQRFVPSSVEKKSDAMLDYVMTVRPPAQAELSALATDKWAAVADKNHLGTPRPVKAVVGHDATRRFMYIIPAPEEVEDALEVKYPDGRASINLYPFFRSLERLLPGGYREVYDLKPTPGQVELDGFKGWGLYVKLSEFTREPIQEISDEEKAKRKQTREARKAKKQTAAADHVTESDTDEDQNAE